MPLQSKVTGHDGKAPRAEVGHVQEALPGSGKRHDEPAMLTALMWASADGGGSGGGLIDGGGGSQLPASPAAEPLPQVSALALSLCQLFVL